MSELSSGGEPGTDVLAGLSKIIFWYEQRFGRPLAAYRSSEYAIATWPTTATRVGVRSDDNGFEVCAPFGLARHITCLHLPVGPFGKQRALTGLVVDQQ